MFSGSGWRLAAGVTFGAFLLLAALWDLRSRRIPNWLVILLASGGLLFSVLVLPPVRGIVHGSGGILVGLILWMPLYAMGVLGAGDVKLFAASGAWLGPLGALQAALLSALAGGVLAGVYMVMRGPMKHAGWVLAAWAPPGSRVAKGLVEGRILAASSLPYGVALAAGAALAAWFPGLLR
ncbi:MAG: prepilin peptidase [Gemmatimonadaceae bacterium]